jgi:cyanophycin synthetase
MAPDLFTPIRENGGAILEVNAAPGFRMHIAPTEGLPRNVAEPVIDMLFPPGTSSRIPIIAVTGTNGKTTTTRLMAHMVKTMGHKVGFTTTDGIYIQNRILQAGDCPLRRVQRIVHCFHQGQDQLLIS